VQRISTWSNIDEGLGARQLTETYRVLVTGSSGFLGPYVTDELTKAGHEVAGFELAQPRLPVASFFKGDFTVKPELMPVLRGIDVVCHLGGIGDVYLAEQDPSRAFLVNAFGTKVVCDACVDSCIEKLVYASTWEVYGKPISAPIDEEHPCNPESSYSISKLAGELFVRSADDQHGIDTIVLRLGTAYGPSMRKSTVISRFIHQSMTGSPLTINGDGSQFRQFTHAVDMGRAFVAALRHSPPRQIYNIVSEESVTMLELAHLISKESEERIEFLPSRQHEPASAQVSSMKALKNLHWKQTIRFEDGLKNLITAINSTESR